MLFVVQIISVCIWLIWSCYFWVVEHLLGTIVGDILLMVFLVNLLSIEMLSGAR